MSDEPTTTIDTEVDPAIARVEKHTVAVTFQAGVFATISSDEEYEKAGRFLTETLKPALKELAATFGPMQQKARAAHLEICAQRKRHEEPLQRAERVVKGAMGAYHLQQQEIVRQAERERLEEARKAAEDSAVEEAARLEREGKNEAAEDRLRQPVVPVVTTPAPEAPKAAGTSVQMAPKYRIIDESKIGRKYLKPNRKKIGQIVRSMGVDAEEVVGGIEVYEEPVVSARATQ